MIRPIVFSFFVALLAIGKPVVATAAPPVPEPRLQWFTDARFGIFVHFGIHTVAGNDWDFPQGNRADLDRYMETKVKPQLRELLTQYGPVGAIWFDTPEQVDRATSTALRQFTVTVPAQQEAYKPTPRQEEFLSWKFGMFVHFGIATCPRVKRINSRACHPRAIPTRPRSVT